MLDCYWFFTATSQHTCACTHVIPCCIYYSLSGAHHQKSAILAPQTHIVEVLVANDSIVSSSQLVGIVSDVSDVLDRIIRWRRQEIQWFRLWSGEKKVDKTKNPEVLPQL